MPHLNLNVARPETQRLDAAFLLNNGLTRSGPPVELGCHPLSVLVVHERKVAVGWNAEADPIVASSTACIRRDCRVHISDISYYVSYTY